MGGNYITYLKFMIFLYLNHFFIIYQYINTIYVFNVKLIS